MLIFYTFPPKQLNLDFQINPALSRFWFLHQFILVVISIFPFFYLKDFSLIPTSQIKLTIQLFSFFLQ